MRDTDNGYFLLERAVEGEGNGGWRKGCLQLPLQGGSQRNATRAQQVDEGQPRANCQCEELAVFIKDNSEFAAQAFYHSTQIVH